MKTNSYSNQFIGILLATFLLISCSQEERNLNLIPYPQVVKHKLGDLDISQGMEIVVASFELAPFVDRVKDEYKGLFLKDLNTEGDNLTKIWFMLEESMGPQQYELSVQKSIVIKGGSYQALSYGLSTLWQLVEPDLTIPKLKINDSPDLPYRSVMIDCGRQWHSIDHLKSIIKLASFYKINYIHLHLTDDQLFTFQSQLYPELASENNSYTKQQLKDLNDYAFLHGVILIPEIDIPGHSSQFVKKLPGIFGIDDPSKNPYTMSMGKELTYSAIDSLFSEIASTFSYSPFIHMGGDEGHFAGMEDDPSTLQYMQANGIESINELFRHFIVRVNDIIKSKDKTTIVWAGFPKEGKIEIPKDIIVMAWEAQYYNPNYLHEDGFDFINATFKPLYVVNNRKWPSEYIYDRWNVNRWESYSNKDSIFSGIEIEPTDQLKGATMCAWEQAAIVELPRLRERLAAMSEKLWQRDANGYAYFQQRFHFTNDKLSRIVSPLKVTKQGLIDYGNPDGNFLDHLRFKDSLTVNLSTDLQNSYILYEFKDSLTTKATTYNKPIKIREATWLTAQVFDKNNKPIGLPFQERYFHFPLVSKLVGPEINEYPNAWDKTRFQDFIEVDFDPLESGRIEFTAKDRNYEAIKLQDPPFRFSETTHLTAQYYDKNGVKKGSPLNESYYELRYDECLTTGKPIFASNDDIQVAAAKKANNGRTTLWEHWGDHNNGANWIMVDLLENTEINLIKLVFFWDNYRYYQYTVETSPDRENWTTVVDASKNEKKATINGQEHAIKKTTARYIKLNMLHNSANPGLHVTEFCAY